MKLFSLTLISVVCCFLCSCEEIGYKVAVETGCSEEGAGTKGHVYITLYGEKGNSSTIRLHNEGKPGFQRCARDTFDISTEELGIVSKIRVELDCTRLSEEDNWFLKTVTVYDDTLKVQQSFPWYRWLETTADQKTESVEIKRNFETKYPDYKVTVETGVEEDAGTHGKVYITLNGGEGDSRKVLLDHEGKSEFQRGQTDTFNITTEDVGIVSKIRIELDSTAESDSPNWFLKKVSLEDLERKRTQLFPWNRWLIPTADEKTISVDIPLFIPKTEYKVTVETGNEEDAGTHGNVYIIIYGEKGHSSKILLDHEGKPEFQKGQMDTFNITTKDVGSVSMIWIELDNTEESDSPNWFLKEVSLEDLERKRTQLFPWNRWLIPTADEKTISVDIPLFIPKTEYKVIVETGNEEDAGTNGNVYIILHGSTGDSHEFRLHHKGKLEFQKGEIDTFNITTKDVGSVSMIWIELDNTEESDSPNWLLKAVSLEDLTRKRSLWFPWNQWLTPTEDQKTIAVKIPLSTDKGKQ